MAEQNGYQRMGELVSKLRSAISGIESGSLGLNELDELCDVSRELNERMIVLRHKAREGAVKGKVEEPAQVKVNEPPIMKLDTTIPAKDRAQISLIDVIQETNTEDPVAVNDPDDNVAGRAVHAPITDLRTAIGLNSKFMFISEIFQDNRAVYDRTLDELNNMKNAKEAHAHLQTKVLSKIDTPPDEEVLERFKLLIDRRYA